MSLLGSCQVGAATSSAGAESVAQSAVDAELILAGFCCLGITGQRILAERGCHARKEKESYDPRSSCHELPSAEFAEFYAIKPDLLHWKSRRKRERFPPDMSGGYLPVALPGLYTEILSSTCRCS
jgi:hypothetical protein